MTVIALISVVFYLLSLFRISFIYLGFLSQCIYLLLRGIQFERLPLVGPHDTLFFLSSSIVAFAIPFALSMKLIPPHPPLAKGGRGDFQIKKQFLRFIVILASVFAIFSFFSRPHNIPLPPVLKTYWFELHVVVSFFSYALFGIAAVMGILFLFFSKEENNTLPSIPSHQGSGGIGDISHRVGGITKKVPSPILGEGKGEGSISEQKLEKFLPEKYEVLQYKAILIGYCMFSLSMIFGGIWAYLAWGTYWLWTPKELWTTILWIFYSLYLHARLRKEWMGRPSAVLGIIGFAITLFTYLGVSLLMKSSHMF